ncbi:MAG: hypothetical protein M0017_06030 [Desulfobacteraceae bacterium]|nr:hypothetical protein [Desulfobacteraceae bacterium]
MENDIVKAVGERFPRRRKNLEALFFASPKESLYDDRDTIVTAATGINQRQAEVPLAGGLWQGLCGCRLRQADRFEQE